MLHNIPDINHLGHTLSAIHHTGEVFKGICNLYQTTYTIFENKTLKGLKDRFREAVNER